MKEMKKMVKYKYLIKSLTLYIKHHDYPKLNAINYYEENKRKFRKEKWDVKDYTDDEKYSSIPGHLFTQQNELQKNIQYDELGIKMIQDYQMDAFWPLSYYHYGRIDELRQWIRHHSLLYWGILDTKIEERNDDGETWITSKQPENITERLDSLVNDSNPDNWFFDNRIALDEANVYNRKYDSWGSYDSEKRKEVEERWREQYSSIKDMENMTPQDWKQFYKECNAPSDLSMKDWSNRMSQVIEQSPRIQTDCIAWRYGELPVDLIKQPSWNPESGMWDGPDEYVKPSLREGLTGTFKGFTGLTYNEKLIQNGSYLKSEAGWTRGSKNRYKIKVVVPHGTQGVVLGDSVGCDSFQNELLLNKNQRFVIYEVNENKKTATIILY